MADKEPPENTSLEAADAVANGTEALSLPAKIRVHALAKLLGLTSKQVIAKAAELGTELSSAHSTLHRDVAEVVYASLSAPAPDVSSETAAPQDAAEQVVRAPEPAGTPAAEEAPAEPASADAAPAESADTAAEAVQLPQVGGPTGLFTSLEQHTPLFEIPEPAPAAEAVAAPLFLQPEVPGRAEDEESTRPRRRRARRGAVKDTDEQTVAPTSTDVQESPATPVAAPAATGDDVDTSSAAENSTGPEDDDQDEHPRRRRRGRRGRGRGRGDNADSDQDEIRTEADDEQSATDEEQAEPASPAEPDTETPAASSDESSDEDSAEDDDQAEGSSRRRRRRRRRRGTADTDGPAEEDSVPTVVHEREPRPKSRVKDEVQGISGSTRLEAKRQRRRDGREAGRRRPPILTESEFLARRESVDRVMVVRERTDGPHTGMTQVAVLEDGILVEHFVTTSGSASMVGNIYLGRVQNVLPSMEAAFIDIGRGRNGVLYAGEVNWEAAGLGGNSRKIEQALKPGDHVVVQVSKDPVGHKGARLTTQISLAGRFLVYVPGGSSTGISRKLPDTERKRLKDILREIVPSEAGVIIRTAAEGVSEDELSRDVTRLQSQWEAISAQADKAQAEANGQPKSLYEEPDLLVKVVRDLFNEDFSKLVIEGDNAWNTVESYIRTVASDLLPRVERFRSESSVDVFGAHRIDEQLAKALDRKVWLPSGGTLVIDRTEAMTVVDVNTGKFTGSGGNLEETVTRNNIEAAEEIVRQMRLRDIGGMIVVDFIDMVLESNRDLVLRRLTEALGRDRTRHQVSEVTSLGLVQMTRKRLGTGLIEAFSTTCEHCNGRGLIVHSEPIESKQSDESSRQQGSSGGSRRKRGRDKSTPDVAPEVVAQPSAPALSQEEVAKRAAHPVALAMSAHHPAHDDESAGEAAAAESSANDADPMKVAEPLQAADPVNVAESARTGAGAGEDTTTATTPDDEPEEIVAEVSAAVRAVTPEAVTPETVAPETGAAESAAQGTAGAGEGKAPEPAPRRRRARRVARAAAAPAGEADAATVFVIPAPAEAPSAAVSAPEPVKAEPVKIDEVKSEAVKSEASGTAAEGAGDKAVAVVRRPRSRRAAGRPAGPPVDAEA